jgi:hypothetical protein
MNPFSRNRRMLEKFVVTNSNNEFNKNSTNGLLADAMKQTDGQAGGRGLHTRRYLHFVKKNLKKGYCSRDFAFRFV